ncbi:MAG: phosphate transport system regulatory protein PhoU [Bacteroidales bacterium 45-6]|nr:MAG: phosphate transport system regulatory protein PhoU [Bacteroidales bacterium 45-6]
MALDNNIKTKQLQLLLNEFELMSKTALTQFQITSKLLEDNSLESLYEEAEANEMIMDRLDVKIREEVVFTIFQFNPMAADLRKIITYQDITTNLERIGDMLLNIIHFLGDIHLESPVFVEIKKHLQSMFSQVGEMMRNAIFCFSNEDSVVAYQVIAADDKVDEEYRTIRSILQEIFANKLLDKSEIKNIMTINAIAHNLERVGDSTTNIAESAIYLADGKDIRHGNK